MENLARLESLAADREGCRIKTAPGRYGVRSFVPLVVSTDGIEIKIEANVDIEFETKSGEIVITCDSGSAVPAELWHVPPAPSSPEAAPPE